jgi:hypothetical protein
MYWQQHLNPMKNIVHLFTLGLFMATLSSCVDAGGYVATRPGYYNRAPAPRPYYPGNSYYGHNHKTYYHSRPAPRPAGVNARVGTRGLPLNVNSSTGLGIF